MNRIATVILLSSMMCPSLSASEIGVKLPTIKIRNKEVDLTPAFEGVFTVTLAAGCLSMLGMAVGGGTTVSALGLSLVETLTGNTYNKTIGFLPAITVRNGIYTFSSALGLNLLVGKIIMVCMRNNIFYYYPQGLEEYTSEMEIDMSECKIRKLNSLRIIINTTILTASSVAGILAYKYYNA